MRALPKPVKVWAVVQKKDNRVVDVHLQRFYAQANSILREDYIQPGMFVPLKKKKRASHEK